MKRARLLVTAGAFGSLLILPAPGLLATPASAASAGTASAGIASAWLASAGIASAGTASSSAAAAGAQAAPGYTVTTGHANRIASSASGVGGLKTITPATSPQLATLRGEPPSKGGTGGGGDSASATPSARTASVRPSARVDQAASAKISRKPAPTASPAAVTTTASTAATSSWGKPSHAFDGVSDSDSDALIDSPITPPDQGLCVGTDTTLKGSPDAVWEPVNEAAQETTKTGTKLRPDISLGTMFQDPYFTGDVRCAYDSSSKTFFFIEIGYPVASGPESDLNNTTLDVAVVNSKGAAEYQFDTSMNDQCFGDQPKLGFDNDALVVSTDQYCDPTETDYEGAAIEVISKPQLTAEAATVNDDVLGPVSIAGNPVTGLDPAIDTGSGTEYFVDSTSFLGAADTPAPSDDKLDLSTLANTASVTTGKGTPQLTAVTLPSEEYVFPVPATSTGDGSTTTLSNGDVITSETAIAPDDDRTSGPVNVTADPRGGLDLWTAVDTAVTPRGDTATRDGSAWFEISTAQRKVVRQGYTAVKGANMVYPAIEALPHGPAAQVFTITGPKLNPAIAYNEPTAGGRVSIVEAGSGPHVSFSDAPPYSQPRWGDYSMAVPDPDGSGIWLATEYIPPAPRQDPEDNWGTYVFEVPAK